MSASETTLQSLAIPPRNRWLRLAVRLAHTIRVGTLTLVMPDGSSVRVEKTPEPHATFILKEPAAIRRLVLGGSLGLAEAYIEGLWDSPSILDVMKVAAANEAEWEAMLSGSFWARAVSRIMHRLRANTRGGAKRNIVEHYDLGNDFYAEWLDPTMTYSAALFDQGGTLEEAQLRKIHKLCRMLELQPGHRLLEIGCGWGAFAEVAARDYGCTVVGLTLSPSQLAAAQTRIDAAGLSDRVEFRLQDYRDVRGQFDRIASIEMFEAVGEAFWPAYFATLRDRLAPGGRAGLQVITIEDRLWPTYKASADFIQRHVFPGGMLPSPTRFRQEIAAAGLAWQDDHWFGQDYAETLARWQARFQQAWPRISAGTRLASRPCDLRFKRLWEYYLAYCETGFRAGWTDVGQIVLTRA